MNSLSPTLKKLHSAKDIMIGSFVGLICQIVSKVLSKKLEFEGVENIPKNENFLLISNHPTWYDYFAIDVVLNEAGIKSTFIVDRFFLENTL